MSERDSRAPWTEYKEWNLREMERVNHTLVRIEDSLTDIKVDLASVKTKSTIWGTLGGLMAAVGMVLLASLKSIFKT